MRSFLPRVHLSLLSLAGLGAAAACSSPSWPTLPGSPPPSSAESPAATAADAGSVSSEWSPPVENAAPSGDFDASSLVYPSASPPADDASAPDSATASDPSPAPTAQPLQSAEMFVHIHGGHPEWWALWIPATPKLNQGMKDPPASVLETAVAKGNWPPPTNNIPDSRGDNGDNGYSSDGGEDDAGGGYTLTTGGQCGSPSVYCYTGENYSPLIIDFGGRGVSLRAPNDGARFDIQGTGQGTLLSWPTDGRANAFLVLDRNGDGRIR